jgi:hypothetical protein
MRIEDCYLAEAMGRRRTLSRSGAKALLAGDRPMTNAATLTTDLMNMLRRISQNTRFIMG